MEAKFERKMMKNWTKGMLRQTFSTLDGSTVKYDPARDQWSISFSVCFNVPEGLETVEQGFEIDVNREGVICFMKEQTAYIHTSIESLFGARPQDHVPVRACYAAPLPPMFGVVQREGKWGWISEEEEKKWSEGSEFMQKALQNDKRLVADGIYELIENADTDWEMDAFVLRKYTALRGFFTYEVTLSKLKGKWLAYHNAQKTA